MSFFFSNLSSNLCAHYYYYIIFAHLFLRVYCIFERGYLEMTPSSSPDWVSQAMCKNMNCVSEKNIVSCQS